jgi:membrane-associated phospholipid phosphatase
MPRDPIKSQSRFWDYCNAIEAPIVKLVQAVLFAKPLWQFWEFIAKLASAKLLAYAPSILYCFGQTREAKRLAISLVFYALLSSFGKSWVIRRRPGSYDDIFAGNCAVTSSFPSRHTIATTVFGNFLPAALQMPYMILLIIDRIACGQHFLSDCLVGITIGKLALVLAPRVENPNLSTALLILALQVWSGGARILAGVLPVLIAPDVKIAKVPVPLACLKTPILAIMRKGKKERDRMKVLTQELLVVSAILFAVVKIDGRLREFNVKELVPNGWRAFF